MYTTIQKFVSVRFFNVFERSDLYSHKGIYLVKNTVKQEDCEILLQFKLFSILIYFKM